jgi:hypothetical protein
MLIDVQLYVGPLAGHGDAGRDDRRVRGADRRGLRAVHRRVRDARDRGTAHGDRARAAVQQFLLLAGGLRALAAGEYEAGLVLDAYLLRSLSVAGWAPSFVDCAKCGAPGPHRAFAVPAGGCVCPQCRPPGAAAPHPQTLDLLAALLTGDWDAAVGQRPAASAGGERHRRGVPAVAPGAPGPVAGAGGALMAVRRRRPRRRPGRAPGSGAAVPAPVRGPAAGRAAESCPRHVAIVMDGNGRWANARGLPRTKGHEMGEGVLLDVVAGAVEIGVAGTVRCTRSRPRTGAARPRRCASSWASTATSSGAAATSCTRGGCGCGWAGRRPKLWRSVIRELEVAEELTRATTSSR